MTQAEIAAFYRNEYGRILAGLIRVVRDISLAEDALQEAFAAAVRQWPEKEPKNKAAWIFGAARHKAIDRLRQRSVEAAHEGTLLDVEADRSDGPMPEDSLRLLFTCCHPALAQEGQIALTLRTLCGLSTDEIARAFLVPASTMAQRLVRAQTKIRDAGLPYEVPEEDALEERLSGVMAAIYLVFNEGYAATFGDSLVRRDLCAEAIRLGRLLVELLPARRDEPRGLLALMLLHDSRRDTRQDEGGTLVRLEAQDRTRWDRAQIVEGAALVTESLGAGPPGPYALQAAIAALHAQAPLAADTDWPQIAALYALLYRVLPTPIVELNRAVAIAMADGAERGLELIDRLAERGDLAGYHLVPAARADLLYRLGRRAEARIEYQRALGAVTNTAERKYLEARLRDAADALSAQGT